MLLVFVNKILWKFVFSLLCKYLHNILGFSSWPTKPKIVSDTVLPHHREMHFRNMFPKNVAKGFISNKRKIIK